MGSLVYLSHMAGQHTDRFAWRQAAQCSPPLIAMIQSPQLLYIYITYSSSIPFGNKDWKYRKYNNHISATVQAQPA